MTTTTKPAADKKAAPAKPAARKAATPAPAKTATLAQAAAAGAVTFYRQRRNGTMRNLPYLAPGTPEGSNGFCRGCLARLGSGSGWRVSTQGL